MSLVNKLHAIVSAICPIDGVSIGDPANKATWRIDFAVNATNEQKAAAQAALDSFDLSAAQAEQLAIAQRIETDRQELQSAKLNNAVTQLLDSTPAQLMTWASNNFPSLTAPEKARMGMIMNMLAVAMRPMMRS